MNGILQHLLLTLRLNLRNAMALVYGYIVPIFTLVAFAAYFRTRPPLVHEMGQLLTIAVLGGACFGLPTAMVNERERGVWRRYRLLPASSSALVVSTMFARYLIVASAGVIELMLAHWGYGMPWPIHPIQLWIAFTFACFAFLGMGLVIAMLAQNVPAVQALGQALFLPVIIIGGVGVPLEILSHWARVVAYFLPGIYAVNAMQACLNVDPVGPHGLPDVGGDLLALVVIGSAALLAGARLFRWDAGQKIRRGAFVWVTVALLAWVGVGLAQSQPWKYWRPHSFVALTTRPSTRPSTRSAPATAPATRPKTGWEAITDADLDSIKYDNLLDYSDEGDVTPFAPNLDSINDDDERKKKLQDFSDNLDKWGPGQVADPLQRTRNMIAVAAIADILQDPNESLIPRVIYQTLDAEFPKEQLIKMLAEIVLHPEKGTMIESAPELDLQAQVDPDEERSRIQIYAEKMLGRETGKIIEPAQ